MSKNTTTKKLFFLKSQKILKEKRLQKKNDIILVLPIEDIDL